MGKESKRGKRRKEEKGRHAENGWILPHMVVFPQGEHGGGGYKRSSKGRIHTAIHGQCQIHAAIHGHISV